MKFYLTAFLFTFSISSFAQDTLTHSDIKSAAKIIGLDLTKPELDSMYENVRSRTRDFSRMRKSSLDNSVPMTLAHSPLLPGMSVPQTQEIITWNIPKNVLLSADKHELAFYNILQLAALIKGRKITSTDLTKYFIDRLKKFGDTLECVISITEEIAMKQAAKADREIAAGKYRGPLHGIPYGLKDLFAVKGTKTTWGAEPYKNQTIDEDAFVYTQLEKAGAVLVAKLTLGALAQGDYWFNGRTKNPWNLERGSSGSSAGSASATVAGLVPFAIGTETWGSIVSPASTCGATGLRPTFGSVSRTGAMTLSWSLDKAGPITRSAEDAAIVFQTIKGTDGKDASAVNAAFNYTGRVDWKTLKIGYAKNYFDKLDSSSNNVKDLEVLRKLGAKLDPVIFPDSGVYTVQMINIIIGAESAAAFDEFTRSGLDDEMTRQTKNDWPNSFRTSRFIPAVEYINANRHRYILMQKVNELFQQYDVVIVPSRGGGNQTAITNLTGHPAICMPDGFTKDGMPTSITFLGKLYGEAKLLAVAKAFQEATNWDETHPGMFK